MPLPPGPGDQRTGIERRQRFTDSGSMGGVLRAEASSPALDRELARSREVLLVFAVPLPPDANLVAALLTPNRP
jgi:hypothetical protein